MTATVATLAVALLAVAAAVVFAAARLTAAVREARSEAAVRHVQMLFAPALQQGPADPQRLLTWYPIAQASRRLFPDAFEALDAACGGTFPFSRQQVQDAHARWTADWLTWERSHDADYTLRNVALQEELARAGAATTALGRARVAALDREKLERYQQRYEEYIRTAKALQAFTQ